MRSVYHWGQYTLNTLALEKVSDLQDMCEDTMDRIVKYLLRNHRYYLKKYNINVAIVWLDDYKHDVYLIIEDIS